MIHICLHIIITFLASVTCTYLKTDRGHYRNVGMVSDDGSFAGAFELLLNCSRDCLRCILRRLNPKGSSLSISSSPTSSSTRTRDICLCTSGLDCADDLCPGDCIVLARPVIVDDGRLLGDSCVRDAATVRRSGELVLGPATVGGRRGVGTGTPKEMALTSCFGVSSNPRKPEVTGEASDPSPGDFNSLRCFAPRATRSMRRRASLVGVPTTGRSISRMVAAFCFLAWALRRSYSARWRWVVKRWATRRSSSSTMR